MIQSSRFSTVAVLYLAVVLVTSFFSGCADSNSGSTKTIISRHTYSEPWASQEPAPTQRIVTKLTFGGDRKSEPTQKTVYSDPDAPRVLRERTRIIEVPAEGPLSFEVVEMSGTISVAFAPGPGAGLDQNDHWVCGHASNNPFGPPPFNPGNIDFSDMHVTGIPQDCIDAGYCSIFGGCDRGGGGGSGDIGGGIGDGGLPGGGLPGGGGSGSDPCPPTDFESCLFCCFDNGMKAFAEDDAPGWCRRLAEETVIDTCWERCNKNIHDVDWMPGTEKLNAKLCNQILDLLTDDDD